MKEEWAKTIPTERGLWEIHGSELGMWTQRVAITADREESLFIHHETIGEAWLDDFAKNNPNSLWRKIT